MRFPPVAIVLALTLSTALASGPSGMDAAGDEHWRQASPGGPDFGAALLCGDDMMDILDYNVWVDGLRLRGSINVTDGDASPTCAAAVELFRLEGFLSIRLHDGAGQSAVLAYDVKDVCIFTVAVGSQQSTSTDFPGDSSCKRVGDEFQFNVTASGTTSRFTYDFRGASLDAKVITAELVGVVPLRAGDGLVFQGHIEDWSFT